MAITLASLREQVRQRADMQNSGFISDSELDLYINNSYFELYDVMVAKFEDYFLKLDPITGVPPEFVLSGGQNYYTLPTDFYKLIGLDILLDANQGSWYSLRKFNFAERSMLQNSNVIAQWARPMGQYRVMGNKIIILPQTYADGTYRFWYIPKCIALTENVDPLLQVDMIDYMDQWSDYVVVDAAIKCLTKEESDPSALMMVKSQLLKRVDELASNRDAGEPERISDVNRGAAMSATGPYGGWGLY